MAIIEFRDDEFSSRFDDGTDLHVACDMVSSSIKYGCKNGMCGTCLINVVKGSQNMSPANDREKETLQMLQAKLGQRLACQCKVNGDVSISSADNKVNIDKL